MTDSGAMTGPGTGDREPGWYHDSDGLVRWWNGARWDDRVPAPNGPVAYPPAPTSSPYGASPGAPGWPPPNEFHAIPGAPGPGGYGGRSAGYPPGGYAMPGAARPGGYAPPGPGYGYAPPGAGYGYAPPPGRSDARTMALFSHLGVFVGGFILPLVIYATVGKEDPFIRHHASESLNFSLSYLMFVVVGMMLSLVTLGIGFIVFFPLLIIVMVMHFVFAIMGAMKASAGEWWRYPVNIRFVKGAY